MLVARPLHRQYVTMSPAQESISVVWGRRSHQNSGKHLHPGLLSMTDLYFQSSLEELDYLYSWFSHVS